MKTILTTINGLSTFDNFKKTCVPKFNIGSYKDVSIWGLSSRYSNADLSKCEKYWFIKNAKNNSYFEVYTGDIVEVFQNEEFSELCWGTKDWPNIILLKNVKKESRVLSKNKLFDIFNINPDFKFQLSLIRDVAFDFNSDITADEFISSYEYFSKLEKQYVGKSVFVGSSSEITQDPTEEIEKCILEGCNCGITKHGFVWAAENVVFRTEDIRSGFVPK